MKQSIHTPGPLTLTEDDTMVAMGSDCYVAQTLAISPKLSAEIREKERANGRLLTAAYNAFDSAAEKLSINAVECAEKMADGAIADLLNALERASFVLRRIHEGDHNALRNALGASAAADELIAKVAGSRRFPST
jgi:hypothetical protein